MEMERLRHKLVTAIQDEKLVRSRGSNSIPSQTHLPGLHGKPPRGRVFNHEPVMDATWVEFARDHNINFEDALVPLERRVSLQDHHTSMPRRSSAASHTTRASIATGNGGLQEDAGDTLDEAMPVVKSRRQAPRDAADARTDRTRVLLDGVDADTL